MFRLALLTILTAMLGGVARAEECAPSAILAGDPALVAALARELDARGIRTAPVEACPSLRVSLTMRGMELVLVVEHPNGSSTKRTLVEVSTAATLVESFTRTDVARPLLATRAIPAAPAAPPVLLRSEQPVPGAGPPLRVHVAASFESSFANDSTTWLGANIKTCIQVGPVCAAARFRLGNVVQGLSSPGTERDFVELLIGVDVPLALGRVWLVPGFAGGLGGMETRVPGSKRSTGGFSGEAQASLWVPLVHRLALEVSLGAGLADFDSSDVMGPTEPWAMFRAGVGLRYGTR